MKFVEVEHPKLGRTHVPESRVDHLGDGWAVVEGGRRKTKGDPKRITQQADTADTNPEAGGAGASQED